MVYGKRFMISVIVTIMFVAFLFTEVNASTQGKKCRKPVSNLVNIDDPIAITSPQMCGFACSYELKQYTMLPTGSAGCCQYNTNNCTLYLYTRKNQFNDMPAFEVNSETVNPEQFFAQAIEIKENISGDYGITKENISKKINELWMKKQSREILLNFDKANLLDYEIAKLEREIATNEENRYDQLIGNNHGFELGKKEI